MPIKKSSEFMSLGFSGTPNNGTPWAPYYSHTTPIRIPKDMGIVWEAYHKGVPLLGVPGKSPLIIWWFLVHTNINLKLRNAHDLQLTGTFLFTFLVSFGKHSRCNGLYQWFINPWWTTTPIIFRKVSKTGIFGGCQVPQNFGTINS